jgi:hypothetical protein
MIGTNEYLSRTCKSAEMTKYLAAPKIKKAKNQKRKVPKGSKDGTSYNQ